MNPDDIENFYQWLRNNECIIKGAEIRQCNDDSGKGLFAVEDCLQNQCIFSLPISFIISNSSISRVEPYKTLIKRCELNPIEMLVLFFLTEDSNPSSTFLPYLKILPRTFNNITFTGCDQEFFHYTGLQSVYEYFKSEIEAKFSKFEQYFGITSLNDFLWALHIVSTRCHYPIDGELLMESMDKELAIVIPFLDMLNHSNNSSVYFEIDYGRLLMKSEQAVRVNEQIYICYGNKSNQTLWFEYGFTLPNNEHNEFTISIANFVSVMRMIGKTVRSENAKIAIEDNSDSELRLKACDLSLFRKFNRTLRILAMNPDELKNWREELLKSERIDENLRSDVLTQLKRLFDDWEKETRPDLRWVWSERISIIENWSLLSTKSSI